MTLDKIDSHQHFWSLERGDYDWLTPAMTVLYRDYLPEDLEPHLPKAGVTGSILVQAAPTEAESYYLLELASHTTFVSGVVGWIDFAAPDAPARIDRIAMYKHCVGLRPMLQDMPDAEWILESALTPVFEAMMRADLTFDALIRPHQIDLIHQLATRYPALRIVVDHCAKPAIGERQLAAWSDRLRHLAEAANVFCKFSGLTTEAGHGWTVEALVPYFDLVWSAFGFRRVLWGSDWPVCLDTTTYDAWSGVCEHLTKDLTADEQRAFFHDNAVRAYRLPAL